MLRVIIGFLLISTFTSTFYSQEIKTDIKNDKIVQGTEKVAAPQDITDDIKFKNETGNAIITITDEGNNVGSITLPSGSAPSTPTNKLYNVSGTLNFNGTALGSGGAAQINDLIDAKTDATCVFLGSGSGADDDGSTNYNTSIGIEALYSNTVGEANTAIGYQSLNLNLSGLRNTAIGYQSLLYNKGGSWNTANGFKALFKNTEGNYNSANGYAVLYSNTTGNKNTGNGYQALFNNTTAEYNTATGYSALVNHIEGSNNTATGSNALFNNTVGSNNTAIGYNALLYNRNGSNGVAIGFESQLYQGNINIPYLNMNTSVGYQSLRGSSAGGNSNSAFGYQALYSNSTGNNNTGNGYQALFNNTGAGNNTATGFQALYSNVSGLYNTAFGSSALYTNYNTNKNTAIGYQALYSNGNSSNTGIGYQALYSNDFGQNNTATGVNALYTNETGNSNTAIGAAALYNNKGEDNTAIGTSALANNLSGDGNTAIGASSGPRSDTKYLSNTTAIGYETRVIGSNQVRIGNSSVTTIGGYQNWTNISDIGYKNNISEDVAGLDFVMGLRPITYNLNITAIAEKLGEDMKNDENGNGVKAQPSAETLASRIKKESITQSGFAAQEVEELANRIGYKFSGVDKPDNEDGFYGLRYAEFVVPLVKAVQEQQEIIEALTKRIEQLEGR